MTLGFQPGSGLLHRAHPFTVLAVALAVTVLVFVLPAPWGPIGSCAALVALAFLGRIPRALLTAGIIVLPMWMFSFLLHGVLGGDALRAITLGARLTAMVLAFLLVVAAVHPSRLVDALLARGLPFSGAYLTSAALQAVPRLRDRGRRILEAQRCRGLRVRGSVGLRIRALVPLALPLVLGALSEVDERATALEARAAGPGVRRTPLDPPRDSLADKAFRWVLAIGTGVAVLVRLVG